MMAKLSRSLFFLLFFFCCGHATAGDTQTGDTQTEDTTSTEATEVNAMVGDVAAGEARYKQTCVNCHGAAGKGVASYPKISGKDIPYTVSMLETYRAGTKVGPNSSLMIMMAKPLTDEEIANLAAYLKDATP